MSSIKNPDCQDRPHNLLFMSTPSLWPLWPFLPLMRRNPGKEEEYGVLCDMLKLMAIPGYSATVFVSNVFLLPRSLDDFFALPREVYDAAEEIYAAGWRVE